MATPAFKGNHTCHFLLVSSHFAKFSAILSHADNLSRNWHTICYFIFGLPQATTNKTIVKQQKKIKNKKIMGKIIGIDLGTTN
ncbi:MAG: hypothetical protein J6I61_00470, partial [Prevotella sp.]|nr:hypothetical protein [Prevotella sp.]